jgi:hypothetical protein
LTKRKFNTNKKQKRRICCALAMLIDGRFG